MAVGAVPGRWSTTELRLTRWISGVVCCAKVSKLSSVYSRKHLPAASRPARRRLDVPPPCSSGL